MKKTILLLLFISSLLFADSKIYLGAGYAYTQENLERTNHTISNNAARVKIGYGDRDAYAVEFSLDYVDNHSKIINQTDNDGKKYGFNIELLKAWDFNIYVNPFLKAGFGAGYLETDADVHNQSLTYGTFNLGGGIFIPLNKHLDIEVAYEHKNLSYQKTDSANSYNDKATLNIGYIGVNTRF